MARPSPNLYPNRFPVSNNTILWDHSVGNPTLATIAAVNSYSGPRVACVSISMETPIRCRWLSGDDDPVELSDTVWQRRVPTVSIPGDYRINPVRLDTNYTISGRPLVFATRFPYLPGSLVAYHNGLVIPISEIIYRTTDDTYTTTVPKRLFQIPLGLTANVGNSADDLYDRLGTFFVSYVPITTDYQPYPLESRFNYSVFPERTITGTVLPVSIYPYVTQILHNTNIIERAIGMTVTQWPASCRYSSSYGNRGGVDSTLADLDIERGMIGRNEITSITSILSAARSAVFRVYTRLDQLLSFALPRPEIPVQEPGALVVVELIEAYTIALTNLVGVINDNSSTIISKLGVSSIRW